MIISKEVYKYTIFKQCWGEQVKCRQEEGLNKGAQDVTHPGFIIISIQVLFPRCLWAAGVGVCDLLDPVHCDGHLGHSGQGRGSEHPRSSAGNGKAEIRHEFLTYINTSYRTSFIWQECSPVVLIQSFMDSTFTQVHSTGLNESLYICLFITFMRIWHSLTKYLGQGLDQDSTTTVDMQRPLIQCCLWRGLDRWRM